MYLRFGCISLLVLTAVALPISISENEQELRDDKRQKIDEDSDTKERLEDIKKVLARITNVEIDKLPEGISSPWAVNTEAGVADQLFQGDIQLTDQQSNNLGMLVDLGQSGDTDRFKRQAATDVETWTNNTVFYEIDGNINERKRNSIKAALSLIQAKTCVQFVEDSTQPNRVKVISGSGCSSQIGMIGGVQELSLADNCESVGTVVHEFMHALGIWHTQMRSDRDKHLDLLLKNVDEGQEHNFGKLTAKNGTNYVPYEYGSVMHYSANSFLKKGENFTILPNSANWEYTYTMGNKMLTFFDVETINAHYQCWSKCKPETSAKCKNDGLPNPNNCKVCNCPSGYAGDLCEKRPVGTPTACGCDLTATTEWQSHTIAVGNWNDTRKDDFAVCTIWISAPKDIPILVTLKSMRNTYCSYGCTTDGIEFKTGYEGRSMTDPRICCDEWTSEKGWDVPIRSAFNPFPVIVYNRERVASYTFEYKQLT